MACAIGRPSRCQRRGRAENRSVGAASGVGGRTKQGVGSCFLFRKTQSSHHVPLSVLTPTLPFDPKCATATMASTLLVDRHVAYIQALGDVRPPQPNLDFLTFLTGENTEQR